MGWIGHAINGSSELWMKRTPSASSRRLHSSGPPPLPSDQSSAIFPPRISTRCGLGKPECLDATLATARSVESTTPTAEKPALSDEQHAERLQQLAERLRSPDGLDHDTLAQIEELSGDEQ